jgi:hypothetical protein
MKTKDGRLCLGKTEIKKIKKLLLHSEIDLSYGGSGTFTKGDNNNNPDLKEMKEVKEAIESIKWILDNAIN